MRRYCRGHTCPHAGCTVPKRSSEAHCPAHARAHAHAAGKKSKKPQRGKQTSVYLGFAGSGGGGGTEGDSAV